MSKQLAEITRLASLLPPQSANSVDLNPLSDLTAIFVALPLNPAKESTRLALHSGLYSLKAVWESLVKAGKLSINSSGGSTHLGAGKKRARGHNDEEEEHDGPAKVITEWLQGLFSSYLTQLANLVQASADVAIATSALKSSFELLSLLAKYVPSYASATRTSRLTTIFAALLTCSSPASHDIQAHFQTQYLLKFHDIQHYFLTISTSFVTTSLQSSSQSSSTVDLTQAPTNLWSLLSEIGTHFPTASSLSSTGKTSSSSSSKVQFFFPPPSLPTPTPPKKKSKSSTNPNDTSTGVFDDSFSSSSDSETDSKKPKPPSLLSLPSHKRVFGHAFLALLKLELDEGLKKKVLEGLNRVVLKNMGPGLVGRLRDWLGDLVGQGGSLAILSLSSLFTLITSHNLEFPEFYEMLYGLLEDRSLMSSRWRARFFREVERCLGSTHLPSTLVASFIKRLASLSLSSPTPSIIIIIPFIYNLLKLHPGCMVLIHRIDDSLDGSFPDPFLSREVNPLKTNALDSSLWELTTLASHYSLNVGGLAKIFNEPIGGNNGKKYEMEDFLDHSFGTMFDQELKRKIKNSPAVAALPKRQPIGDSFFPISAVGKTGEKEAESAEGEEVVKESVDIVSSLWTF